MKDWSKTWKASKLPKKQRKYVYLLPAHLKGKLLCAHLCKELRKKYSTRSIRIRKGDKVKIVRGQNKTKTGTVELVDTKNIKIYISGIEFTKRDGSKAKQPIHPSNVVIQELDTTDKRRFAAPTNKEPSKTKNTIKTATNPEAKK